jgi:hypothetical protein
MQHFTDTSDKIHEALFSTPMLATKIQPTSEKPNDEENNEEGFITKLLCIGPRSEEKPSTKPCVLFHCVRRVSC